MTSQKPSATRVLPEQLERARGALRELRVEGVTLHAAVKDLVPEIRKALKHGATYEQICATLGEAGIEVKASTLKSYMRARSRPAKPAEAVQAAGGAQ
jgi:hypothetical protein